MATLTRSETGNQAPDTGIRLEPRDSVLLTKDRFPAPSEAISAEEAATRLGICVRSVHKLIRRGVLPATQLMHSAPWQIPVATLETEAVKIGIGQVIHRRPRSYRRFQQDKTLKLPGF